MPDKPLDGRVALITGCSRKIGIGFATAKRLAALGADLFIHSFSPYGAQQPYGADPDGMALVLLEQLRALGGRVVGILHPVSNQLIKEQFSCRFVT